MVLHMNRMVLRALFVAALLLLLLLTTAWVFYADDRVPSHSQRIGTFTIDLPEGSGTGTAFLISECSILTNFHVVFGPWTVTALRPPSHEFVGTFTLTEVTLPDGTHPAARAIPVAWGDYLGPERQWRRPGEDWVMLYVQPCLGNRYGYFELREADLYEPPVEKGFTAIGYSTGRQMADPRCAARPASDPASDPGGEARGWLHDCAVRAGDSGGPVFHNGTLIVVALASAYRAGPDGRPCHTAIPDRMAEMLAQWDRGCANIAVPVTTAMRERIWDACARVGAQVMLRRLGYDSGPVGAIGSPKLETALRQAYRDNNWPMPDQPLHHFSTMKWLQYRAVTGMDP
jgi:hypothetical protein